MLDPPQGPWPPRLQQPLQAVEEDEVTGLGRGVLRVGGGVKFMLSYAVGRPVMPRVCKPAP
eukprot:15463810-Alexandrium_andersonii.AAC.1